MFRSPFSHFLVTAFRAPAGYYPATGYRHIDGGIAYGDAPVRAQSAMARNELSGVQAVTLGASDSAVTVLDVDYRARGFTVRCLQVFTSDLVSRMLAFPFAVFVIPKRSEGSSLYLR